MSQINKSRTTNQCSDDSVAIVAGTGAQVSGAMSVDLSWFFFSNYCSKSLNIDNFLPPPPNQGFGGIR